MKVSTRVGVTRRIEAGAQVQHSVDVALKTQTEAVARASVSCLAELREQLLVAGDIKVEDEPELEDVELDEEDSPEMEMDDEDEYVESEGEGEYGNPSADDMGVFRRDTFELRVLRDGNKCRCDVPQSGWEGVAGVTPYGKNVVKTVSVRMQVYLEIAIWLENKHNEFLRKGPFCLKSALCTQKELLLSGPIKRVLGKNKDGGASALSRYLKNVDLVWPEGALPLRKCF